MNKRNILVLSSSYPKFSGDVNGVFIHSFCKSLTSKFNIFVIAPWENGIAKEEVLDGVHIIRHKQFLWNVNFAYGVGIEDKLKQNRLLYFVVPFFFFFQMLEVRRVMREYDIGLIHAHWLIPSALVAVFYKILFKKKTRIISTLLGSDVWSFNKGLKKKILRFTCDKIDVITAQSAPLREEIIQVGFKGISYLLPLGIDTEKFKPNHLNNDVRKKHEIKGFFLLFVGSIIEGKGVITLVESMALLKKRNDNFKLLIVGAGNLEHRLQLMINQNGLENHVELTGPIPNEELPPFFSNADIFVLPSFSEGFPLVVMEAISSGTVPVVSDLSVFADNENREDLFYLVKAGNAENIAQVLANLMDNPDEIKKRKDSLRKFAIENYEVTIIAERYARVYEDLLEKQGVLKSK